jgi:hypothetical protein
MYLDAAGLHVFEDLHHLPRVVLAPADGEQGLVHQHIRLCPSTATK